MIFSDAALARRLERAEGFACAQYAEAQRRQNKNAAAEWTQLKGAFVVFNAVDSPVTQSFGLGLTEPLSASTLDEAEEFFVTRGANPVFEISPFAGVAGLQLFCERGYRPVELSSVMWRSAEEDGGGSSPIRVRVIEPSDTAEWSRVLARGWEHDQLDVLPDREGTICFLAEYDGVAGAAGALSIHEGVALFAGAATVPELRRRGLQTALLKERRRYAAAQGCDLLMMVTEIGSQSQRNAERHGFRIAYTRTKWELTRR